MYYVLKYLPNVQFFYENYDIYINVRIYNALLGLPYLHPILSSFLNNCGQAIWTQKREAVALFSLYHVLYKLADTDRKLSYKSYHPPAAFDAVNRVVWQN